MDTNIIFDDAVITNNEDGELILECGFCDEKVCAVEAQDTLPVLIRTFATHGSRAPSGAGVSRLPQIGG